MKNIFKLIFITIIGLLVLSGCSDNSPKGATLAFLNAMKDGNVEDFRKYSTQSTQQVMAFALAMQCKGAIKEDSALSTCLKSVTKDVSKYKVVDVQENGKTSAIVTAEIYSKDGNINKESYNLEKFADEWKINISK